MRSGVTPRKYRIGLKRLAMTGLAVAAVLVMTGLALADTAVFCAGAPDYSSGAHGVISVDPSSGPRSATVDLAPTAISDLIILSYGEFFFRMERYKSDSLSKFGISNPSHAIFQFSTLDSPDQVSNNAHDMVFLNVNKAYIPMFGNNKAWIVNPSATSEAEWKTGELDLSAYADSDGIAEPHVGVIVGGKLFVVIQRLNRDSKWWPMNKAYVAVFDTATDTEINTGKDAAEGRKGIPLPVKSPNAIKYSPELNKIFISCAGRYPTGDPTGYEYTGGIVTVDPDTYEATLLIDDGDADNHPYGAIGSMELLSPTQGYFVGYAGYNDTTTFQFNPTTGEVGGAIDFLTNKSVTVSTPGGLSVDKNGKLWVTNKTDAQMIVINPADNSINETIPTNLLPGTNTFCSDPGALATWVDNWYVQAFDRQGTEEEVAGMTAALMGGQHTALSMATSFITNSAFTDRGLTHEQYVNFLCQAFFSRSASAEETEYYAGLINNGASRTEVMSMFVKSSQFWRMCPVLGIQAF